MSKLTSWLLVALVLVACLFLAMGVIDQDHWDAFVRGLFSIAVSSDHPA